MRPVAATGFLERGERRACPFHLHRRERTELRIGRECREAVGQALIFGVARNGAMRDCNRCKGDCGEDDGKTRAHCCTASSTWRAASR